MASNIEPIKYSALNFQRFINKLISYNGENHSPFDLTQTVKAVYDDGLTLHNYEVAEVGGLHGDSSITLFLRRL